MARASSSNLFLMFTKSIYALIVPRIYVLMFSKRFPNSILIIPHVDLVALTPLLVFALLLEYFLHSSIIYLNGFWDTSLDAIRFNKSTYSFKMPFKKIVLMVALFSLFLIF